MTGLGSRSAAWTALICLAGLAAGAAERKLGTTEFFPVEEDTKVVVDAGDLNVFIRGGEVADVGLRTDLRISGVGEKKADQWIADRTPAVTSGQQELRIAVQSMSSPFMGIGNLTSRARLTLVLPTGVVPDITTTTGGIRIRGDFPRAAPLWLRSSEGNMHFVGVAHSLEIRTASGNAELEVFRALQSLEARSSSGSVSLTGGAQDLRVDTASGNITLANLGGSALVETTRGRVQLRWDRIDPEHRVKVTSTSGRVELTIPEGVTPRGRLTTVSGSIHCDLPGSFNESGDTFSLSGGGPLIEVETASSEIVLSTGAFWEE
jgi:hypothetical protein